MKSPLSILKSLLAVAILLALPFFQGGETATGLFLVHSLTLVLAIILVLSGTRISVPRFLIYFTPFFLSLILSFLIAPYKYSAFLKFWDYCIAAVLLVSFFSLFNEETETRFSNLYPLFLALTASLFVSVFFSESNRLRVAGSFLNPNDFALFCLLALLLGLYLFEHESRIKQRRILVICMALLTVFIALSSSRATFVAAVAFTILYIRRAKRPLFLILGVVAGLCLAGGLLYYRFSRYPDPYSYYRFRIWQHSIEGVLADPYLGIGLNMLPFRAARFNFPADTPVGRYAKIARSADSQYFQLLGETGFLGLFTFLIGWFALYYMLRKTPERFRTLADSFVVVSIVALFSLPLENTAVLFLFFFLISAPFAFGASQKPLLFNPGKVVRIAVACLLGFAFFVAVWLPFSADREFHAAVSSTTSAAAKEHLDRAVYLNPYQPYYKFAFVKRVVDSKANLEPYRLLFLIRSLNESIELNPLESEFYVYRARIYRQLYDLTQHYNYFGSSISSYQAAIDNSPYNVFVRTEYATFAARVGRYDLAVSELLKVLETEPAFLQARLLLVRVLLTLHQDQEARKQFQTFEEYYNRYRNYVSPESSTYVRNLLTVDAQALDEVRQRLKSQT